MKEGNMTGTINVNYTLIPDEAEVWLALAADVSDIETMIPTTVDDDLGELGWTFAGLINDENGISLTPSSEVMKYNGFGHRNYRTKIKNGELETGFTALEVQNPIIKAITLPGSAANRIGPPQNIQVYVLYRVVDEDTAGGTIVWVTLSSAAIQVDAHSGFVEAGQTEIGMKVYHTTNADGDIFEVVDDEDES